MRKKTDIVSYVVRRFAGVSIIRNTFFGLFVV